MSQDGVVGSQVFERCQIIMARVVPRAERKKPPQILLSRHHRPHSPTYPFATNIIWDLSLGEVPKRCLSHCDGSLSVVSKRMIER